MVTDNGEQECTDNKLFKVMNHKYINILTELLNLESIVLQQENIL